MTDASKDAAPETPPERRQTRGTDNMLAGSSPDVNAIFQGLVDKFMSAGKLVGPAFAWWLSNIWIVAAIGVPAMLAAAPLLDKVYAGSAAEREFQVKMFQLQTDVEIKKLDRTLITDGAMKTLAEISKKLDDQATKLDQQHAQIAKVVADVQSVSDNQTAMSRRLSGVANRQGQLEKRMGQPETE